MKPIFILLFLIGCWSDPDPTWHCTCSDPMIDEYFYGYTEDEIQQVIDDMRVDSVELICTEI